MTVKEQVIQARMGGYSYGEIFKEFGIPKSTARSWINKKFGVEVSRDFSCLDFPVLDATAYTNSNFSRDKPKRFNKNSEEVLKFLGDLAPIKIHSTYIPPTKELNKFAVVGSDFHFGCQDDNAINIFLATVEELQPSTIILNGDLMDFMAVSRFPKDLKHRWTLEDERIHYHIFLDRLIGLSNGAQIYETVSNHSGASVDGRWRRYLADRLGELASLPEIVDTLSYQNVFMGDYQNYIKHVDYVDLNGLIVTHGTTVRANGGASCLGEINKWKTSILHGHTHRIGASCQRVPAIGERSESQIFGFEGGCLCSLDAVYGTAMNWQQGFNIVGLGGDTFSMEQVMIQNGKANVSTLGKTIFA